MKSVLNYLVDRIRRLEAEAEASTQCRSERAFLQKQVVDLKATLSTRESKISVLESRIDSLIAEIEDAR